MTRLHRMARLAFHGIGRGVPISDFFCGTLTALSGTPPNSILPLPNVTVTGPIALTTPLRDPAHGYPYNASPMDLARRGYVEEEFFIEGQANAYNTAPRSNGHQKTATTPSRAALWFAGPSPHRSSTVL